MNLTRLLAFCSTLALLPSCSSNFGSSEIGYSENSSDLQTTSETDPEPETVYMTFIQHTFRGISITEGSPTLYYFENDEIARTVLEYQKEHYLTSEEIDVFYRHDSGLNYKVPQLNGGGYWSFTDFLLDFDEETKIATNPLTPQMLLEDTTVHFAIWG